MVTYWLKIANFFYPIYLMPSLGVNRFEFLDELFITKTRVLGISVGEDFLDLGYGDSMPACSGQMDRQLDHT